MQVLVFCKFGTLFLNEILLSKQEIIDNMYFYTDRETAKIVRKVWNLSGVNFITMNSYGIWKLFLDHFITFSIQFMSTQLLMNKVNCTSSRGLKIIIKTIHVRWSSIFLFMGIMFLMSMLFYSTKYLTKYLTIAGLYVLSSEPVKIPWFDSVLADIGDEQSLSQSLSTFSGHLRQINVSWCIYV